MWSMIWPWLAILLAYSIGKGTGRAQGRDERTPPIHLTVEVNGDPIGGLMIAGLRPNELGGDPLGP